MRFYLPIDKLVSCITDKKKKEKKEEVEPVKQIEETSEVEENAKEPEEVETVPAETEAKAETCTCCCKEEKEEKYCFVKSLIKGLLRSAFLIVPYFLMFIFVFEKVNALIIIGVMFGVDLISNLLVDILNIKTKKTFGILLDLCLHIFAISVLFMKIPFNDTLDDLFTYFILLGLGLLFIKPIGLLMSAITEDFFGEETPIISPDGIIGIFLRITVAFLITQNAITAIIFLLAIIVAVKYRDLVNTDTRNKCVVSLIANTFIPILVMLLFGLL